MQGRSPDFPSDSLYEFASGRVRSLLVLLAFSMGSPAGLAAAEACDGQTLREDIWQDAAFGDAETAVFSFSPGRSGSWLIEVRQHRLDVELLIGGSREGEIRVNSPTGRDGRDSALFATSDDDTVCIELESEQPPSAASRVEVRLTALSDVSETPREKILRYLHDGDRRYVLDDQNELRAALRSYRIAAKLAVAYGLPDLGARARFSEAIGFRVLGMSSEAATAFGVAADRYSELGDQAMAAWGQTQHGLELLYLAEFEKSGAASRIAQTLFADLENEAGTATVANNLCLLLQYRGSYREAVPCYYDVVERFLALRETGSLAVVYNNLGLVLDLTGDPDSAREYFDEALRLYEQIEDAAGAAQALNNLGLLERRLGNFLDAIANYENALQFREEQGDAIVRAALLHNIGLAYYYLGDERRALRYLQRALPVRRDAGDRRGEASTLSGLGSTYLRLGQGDAAADAFRRANDIRLSLDDKTGQARAFLRLGESLGIDGDIDAALGNIDRAQALFDSAGDVRYVAESHYKRAAVLENVDLDAAVRNYRMAVRLWQDIEDPLGPARATLGLARAEYRRGNLASALQEAGRSIEMTDAIRASILDPRLRVTFLSIRQEAYRKRIEILMALDRDEPSAGYARQALLINDRRLARSLDEILLQRNVSRDRGEHRAETDERIRRLSAEISSLIAAGADTETVQRRRAAMDDLKLRRESTAAASGGGGRDVSAPDKADIAELQSAMQPGDLALQFFLGEDTGYVWVIDAQSVTSHAIPGRDAVRDAVLRAVQSLARPVAGGGCDRLAAVAELSDRLLGPVRQHVADVKRLTIVADGVLAQVPFSLLAAEAAGDPSNSGCYRPVLDIASVSHTPSLLSPARVPRHAVVDAGAGPRSLVVSDAVYSLSDPRVSGRSAPTAVQRTGGADLPRLRWSAVEAERLRDIVGPRNVRSLSGPGALKSAIADADLRAYDIIHLAVHGLFDAEQPDIASLVFSRYGERGDRVDGYLTLQDMLNLRLGSPLVVLSGCNTGLGEAVDGEGFVGMTRAMLQSGATAVVSSLWNVDDAATAELMGEFYSELLLRNRTPEAALRRAKLKVRTFPQWQDPYFWAGFTVQRASAF